MESISDPSKDQVFEEIKQEDDDEDELVRVSADQLIGKFRSKADIYNFLTLKYQLFLPPYEETKLRFLKDLMNGSKEGILSCKINRVKAPRYPEISVKSLWPIVKDDAKINKFFPSYSEGKLPSSEFFFGIIGYIAPEFLSTAIEDCLVKRHSVQQHEKSEDYIELKRSVYKAIIEAQWTSKSKGKGVYLLKRSAKGTGKRRQKQERVLSNKIKELLKQS